MQTKGSGMWWIIGKSREDKDKDSDTVSIGSTSSVNKDLPPVPLSIASADANTRPTPKKSMSWDFPSLKNFTVPKRSSTMSTIETMSTLSASATTASEKSVSSNHFTPSPLIPPSLPSAKDSGNGTRSLFSIVPYPLDNKNNVVQQQQPWHMRPRGW